MTNVTVPSGGFGAPNPAAGHPADTPDSAYAWGVPAASGNRTAGRTLFAVLIAVVAVVVLAMLVGGYLFFFADSAGAAGSCGGG